MGLPAQSLHPDEEAERALTRKILDFYADPLGYVLFAYPWLEPNTPLAKMDGPDIWQRKFLTDLGNAIRAGFPAEKAIRMAVASGHGVGKTACVAWIISWFMSTRPKPQVVVTANTQSQLTTKTWRELAKWNDLSINGHWFEHTATSFKMKSNPKVWFATATPWSAGNSSAFAGTHESHVLMLFDEASEIDSIIWEVAEGAMTTPGAIWLCFGNPTSNTGRFRQCWTKFRKRWLTFQVDSRDAKMADKTQLEEWIEDYGIESDFVKVRVLGEFPSTGVRQLIGVDVVERAIERGDPTNKELYINPKSIPYNIPKVMGVDVGSYGDAQNCIVRRQGPVMFPDIIRWREANPNNIAGRISEAINKFEPDVVFIDANGHGHGVYLILVALGFDNIIPVYAGDRDKKAMDTVTFYNKRIMMWYRMKTWLEHSAIPDDRELFEDLIGPEYTYDMAMKMRLERKEEMTKRGLPPPDTGDALSMTFAEEVPAKLEMGAMFENSAMMEPEIE